MKSIPAVLAIVFAFALVGCSTPYTLTSVPRTSAYWQAQYISYGELNSKWEGRNIRIVLANGNEERGKFVHADSTSVAWIAEEFGVYEKIPITTVRRLVLSRNYPWEGAGAGFLIVAGSMVWSGWWAPGQEGMNPPETVYTGRYITVAGGVAGALLGAAGGSLITRTDEIQIVPVAGPSTSKSDSTK
jgi:outer membrane lipoprotein SlyB